jgi:hypothetical protein
MSRRLLACCAVVLLCSCTVGSNWYLMDSGYAINPIPSSPDGYAIEMHVNQLQQLGGDVSSAKVRLFAAERLKWHGLCPAGWQPLDCVRDGSCVQRTARSVTVPGRCSTAL